MKNPWNPHKTWHAGQYYPTYAYGHPLFTEGMHIYSDTKVSDSLCGMTGEESIGFLNDWNASCDHREKIYISYDSTNKNSEDGNIEMPKNTTLIHFMIQTEAIAFFGSDKKIEEKKPKPAGRRGRKRKTSK